MAVKKEAAAAVESEVQTPEAEEMETIQLFSDGGKYKGDLFVGVNGVNYQIKRGVPVKVPKAVAEVIRHSQEQDAQSAARMEAIVAKSE